MPDAARGVPPGGRSAARAASREPQTVEDEFGTRRARRRSPPTATSCTPSSSRNGYEGAYLPGLRRAASPRTADDGVGLLAIDHIVGNVELGQHGRLGRVLRARLRDDRDDPLQRRRHLDRVLGADVEGDDGRPGQGQVPDQRAGRGQAQEPDRRVPRVQRRPRRAARRAAVVEHRRDGRGAAAPRRRLPRRRPTRTTRRRPTASARSTRAGTTCAGCASSPTATTTATCCRSSRRPRRTGRRSSSR